QGPRAVFLIDIQNPCWMLRVADLRSAVHLSAAVGQVPFNFQIGRDIEPIRLHPPHRAAGELELRVDGCEGEPLAVLPLAPAARNDAVTELPPIELPDAGRALKGAPSLSFPFPQRTLDPLWAIDWVQLSP